MENTRFKRGDNLYSELTALIGKDLGDSISLSQLFTLSKYSNDLIYKLLPANFEDKFYYCRPHTSLADIFIVDLYPISTPEL